MITFWMSAVPPGCSATMALRGTRRLCPPEKSHSGSVVRAYGPKRSVQRVGDVEAAELAVVGRLRALVGHRLVGAVHPVVAQVEEARDLGLHEDVGEAVAGVGVLDERVAVALAFCAQLAARSNQRLRPMRPPRAVLELEVGAGDLPAVVLAADEVRGGHAHVVEVDGVLDGLPTPSPPSPRRSMRADRDAGQVGRDHEPGEVLVALAVRVGAGEGPEVVGAVEPPTNTFSPLSDVLVAVAARVGLRAGQVGAGLGAGEELPGDDVAREDRGQEACLLLLGAPDEDARAAERAAAVVVGRQPRS